MPHGLLAGGTELTRPEEKMASPSGAGFKAVLFRHPERIPFPVYYPMPLIVEVSRRHTVSEGRGSGFNPTQYLLAV